MENERRATQKAVFENNKQLLIDACKASGITMLVSEYSGSGDEGRIDSRTAFIGTEGVDFPDGVVTVQQIKERFCEEARDWKQFVIESEITVEELLDHMTDEAIDLSNHKDYQDGTGGGGELSVKVGEGVLALLHYDVVETHEEACHEL